MKVITFKKVLFISSLLFGLLLLLILLSVTLGSVRIPLRRSLEILLQPILGWKGEWNETEKTIILSLYKTLVFVKHSIKINSPSCNPNILEAGKKQNVNN